MLTNRVLSRVILSPLSTSVAYSQRLPTSIDNENRRLQINNEKTTLSLSQSRRGYNNCTSSRNVCLKGLSRLPHRDVLSHSLEPFLDCQENVIYIPARLKSKDKGKGGKGGKGGSRVRFDDSFAEVIDHEQFQTEIKEAFEKLSEDLAVQCAVKSGAGTFDRLVVNTVDGEFSLNELGTITQKSSSLIVVNMSSLPSYIPDVVNAINESNFNVNPQQDGSQIILPLPKITKDHRTHLAAEAKKRLESMKVDCRRIFGHHSTIAKKKKELGFSEDAVFMVEKWLKQEMDEVIAKADSLVKEKQAEVLDTSRS